MSRILPRYIHSSISPSLNLWIFPFALSADLSFHETLCGTAREVFVILVLGKEGALGGQAQF